MTRTRMLHVRLTKEQHEQLKDLAQKKGFPSLAAYMRYVGLDQDLAMYDRVVEMHRDLRALRASLQVPPAPEKRRAPVEVRRDLERAEDSA